MHYNFFAGKRDKLTILDFIFTQTDLQVYDHYSPYGQEISVYKNTVEIAEKFDLENGGKFSVNFQLWSPRHKGAPLFRKVLLDPKRCNGHTFRYNTIGWGLIQLYFGGVSKNILCQSHIGHFNEKGALNAGLYDIDVDKAAVSEWNWNEIQVTSRKLKYHIHNKLSVKKIGSVGVLPAAEEMLATGTGFI